VQHTALPAITCTRTSTNASFWAGLADIKSRNIEQAGVQALCRSGHPHYAAWWQLFPGPAVTIAIGVHPGDVITVAVANPTGTQASIDRLIGNAGDQAAGRMPRPDLTYTE
jgi:hypothetical protein